MSCARRPTHASITDGANSAPTSSTVAAPVTSSTASRDRRVVEMGDDPHVRPEIAYEQHRLQRPQVGRLGDHHGERPGDPRVEQRLAEMASTRQRRHAPASRQPRGLPATVVEDDDPRTRQAELLDRAQADLVQAAHDHVADPLSRIGRVGRRLLERAILEPAGHADILAPRALPGHGPPG